MSNFIKKLFGTLTEKPWESERAKIDDCLLYTSDAADE